MTVAELVRCVGCGSDFEQVVSGPLRKHCTACRPVRSAPKPTRKAVRSLEVAGEPFTVDHFAAWAELLELDSGDKWVLDGFQRLFVADVFDGFRECWLIVPEGNGKSTLIAGLALYHIQHRDDARVPVAASTRDQAGIIYRQAEGFVRRNKLEGVFRCMPGYRRIECAASRSTIQIHAADAGTADGEIFTFGILDELHRQTLDLYRTWNGKLDKRDGAQLAVISTAGEPGGEFEGEREALRRTADRVEREGCFTRAVSQTSVLHDYAVPETGDVEDMELVASANPFSKITAETLAAKRKRIRHLGHWKRFTCNIATRADEAAISEIEWHAAITDERIPAGEQVWLGIDLGWKWDTTALVPLWIRDLGFRLLGKASILEPPRDETMLNPRLVENAILEIHERNPIHTVVMDPTDGAQLAMWLEETIGCVVVDRPQNSRKAQIQDYASFTDALRNGWLKHTGDQGLTRHVLNAVGKMLPGGAVFFDRPRANRRSRFQDERVIDALDAAAMVHTVAAENFGGAEEPLIAWR